MNHQSTQRGETSGKQRPYFESRGVQGQDMGAASDDAGASKSELHESSARETFEKVQEQTKKVVDQAQQTTRDLLSNLKPHFAPIDELFQKTTREHPYLVVLSAATATFLTGFFTRRRTAMGLGVMLGFLGGCYLSTKSILERDRS